jgi:glycosyltransferase involved in cell wall biosynthesis
MRIIVDYRAGLRARTGVGEYLTGLIRAYCALYRDEVALFTSSWKDRPDPQLSSHVGARVIDRQIPVRILNGLWHRAGWPPIEALAGDADVAHASHPLLIPARRAAQVVTVHDLHFLAHPEQTSAEIRRDYPALARPHTQRADAVLTTTDHVKAQVCAQLNVSADKVYVCKPGAPRWTSLGHAPHVPRDGYVLFIGTLEPRKNVVTLLDAYERLLRGGRTPPRLVLAGGATPDADSWLPRLKAAPLEGMVEYRGYVADADREALLAGARLLVLPSLDEGFGLPVLEAMSAGIPVLTSNRGALPEVAGGAGTLVDATDTEGLADALDRLTRDTAFAEERARAGLEQARTFSWTAAAAQLHRAYTDAVVRRRQRGAGGAVS